MLVCFILIKKNREKQLVLGLTAFFVPKIRLE